jgi:plasmid stabilization system protein ParE
MTLAFDILPQAEQDIVSYGDYLAERSLSAAERFADAVDARSKCCSKIPKWANCCVPI